MSLLEHIHSPADLKALSRAQLDTLVIEMRHVIIQTVARRAGHLAPNLGVIELTLALHRVFDSPTDKIIWDVGHQSYPHKLVTGRFERFDTLRTQGGIAGYPRRQESEHDPFGTCHGSTSISPPLGLAGAREGARRVKEGLQSLVVPGILFEEFGLKYFGPIDGHDYDLLEETLSDLRRFEGPTLLHVVTKKGKGYAPAEGDATMFHGVGVFDPDTGTASKS